MSVSFDNTQVAFSSRSDNDLKRSYWLFRLISSPTLVSIGKILTEIAVAIYFPMKWILKPTIFRQFCGGETVEESQIKTKELAKANIKSVLDYSAEGKQTEKSFESCTVQTIDIILAAEKNKDIAFSVFKPTGMARFALLEKTSSKKNLSDEEQKEFERVKERFNRICQAAHDSNVPLFIDAEESWIQKAVDDLTNEMMAKHNKQKAIVFNTFQFYRKDRLEFLIECFIKAQKENYFLGAKLVRGAYMEKERARAKKMGYLSPIQDAKESCDIHYDSAIRFCMEHLDRVSFCAATHNEKSSALVIKLMQEKNLPNNHSNIFFSQLLGMSDHISYNLAAAGYNVSKYVPFGPVREVIPYLIRRAEENTSVRGQTSRELNLILKELERRKKQ